MSKKLSLVNTSASSLKEVWECFIISKTSKCVSDATLSNYYHHLRAIAKHLDIEMPLEELSKRHLERMVVSMKETGLAHNTIATYLRVMNTFLRWCQDEGLTNVSMPNLKERETVKETLIFVFLRFCFPQSLWPYYTVEPIHYNGIGSK